MNFNTPDIKRIKNIQQTLTESNYASTFYEQLAMMINDFESELDQEHEIGARLVSFGKSIQFHIEDIGFQNPSLITFFGTLESGSKVELIQHVSQISFFVDGFT